MYSIYYTKDAQNDAKKVANSSVREKIEKLLEILQVNPFQNPPPYKKLKGQFSSAYSRRITLQHRLFYTIDEESKNIKVLRMWTHYGDN